VSSEASVDSIECGTDVRQEGDRFRLVAGLLKMEAIRSSKPSVLIRATRCHLPEDDNHHSHRRGNLKSYKVRIVLYMAVNQY
jgi:hypothetical protein